MIVLSSIMVGILILCALFLLWLVYTLGQWRKEVEWQEKLGHLRGEVADKQRAGIKGKVTEMFAPHLPGFPFKSSECKFIGDPIDYIVFEGLDDRHVRAIHFIDVKADSSVLKKHQQEIKDLITSLNSNKITFHTFHFSTK